MRYVLDTHAWIWMLEAPERLPPGVRRLVRTASAYPIGLAAISLWEVAMLVHKGRLALSMPIGEWVEQALDPTFLSLLPLTAGVALESARLPAEAPTDPADRLIIATARTRNAALITADRQIQQLPAVRTLWD